MKSNREIEELLKISLKDDINELESVRKKLIAKAVRLKLYLLLLLLGLLTKFYSEIYMEYSGEEMNLGFAIFSIMVLIGYIYLKPESLVSKKNIRVFYKKVKMDFFQKSINLIDSNIEYSPIYKTHISYIEKSGFWCGSYTIAKEDDGLLFDFNKMKARLSELKIYRGTKKIFSGIFIKVDFYEKDFICKSELSNYIYSIKNKIEQDFKVSIRESSTDNTFYYAIDFNRELCEVKLSSKNKVNFDNRKEDLLILYNLISFVNIINSFTMHLVKK